MEEELNDAKSEYRRNRTDKDGIIAFPPAFFPPHSLLPRER